ncbi:phospholipase ABHD3-like [Styela clava]
MAFREHTSFFIALINLATICFVIVWYIHSYVSNYGKFPLVFCKQGTTLDIIIKNEIPILKRRYMPLFWCPGSRCQIMLMSCLRPFSKLNYRREVITEPNGGQFYLDWIDNDNNERFPDSTIRPTVFVLPGLTSCSNVSYVKSTVNRLTEDGYRVMVIVYRGLVGMQLKTPETYCATKTNDIHHAIQHFRQHYPKSQLFAVGISMGAILLGIYLSQNSEKYGLEAAMLFSCPFNAPLSAKETELWKNRIIFNQYVAWERKRIYRKHCKVFQDIVDHKKIIQATDLREFDKHFTAPLFGYRNAEEYYQDCLLNETKLKAIKIPLLCVGSNDDMYSPERGLPKKEVCRTDYVALVMTRGGGHVCHLQGFNPYSKTYFEQIMTEYLFAMVNNSQSHMYITHTK